MSEPNHIRGLATAKPDKRAVERLLRRATIVHEALPEESSPADCLNPADVADVRALAQRTLWGWCCVRTTATLDGFSASVYLGCCCYQSAADFERADGGCQAYEACHALLRELADTAHRGSTASTLLKVLRRVGS